MKSLKKKSKNKLYKWHKKIKNDLKISKKNNCILVLEISFCEHMNKQAGMFVYKILIFTCLVTLPWTNPSM